MKETKFLKRSKKFALGIALALGCNVLSMGLMSNVEAAEFDVPIAGIDSTTNATYTDAGILVDGQYVFNDAETTLNKGGTVSVGGWVASSVNAVISNNNANADLVIDLQGNDLNINSSQTGITAGNDAKIDIYNPGKITIDTNSTGMAAAFFVKTGGQIHVHNGGEDGAPASWDNAVVVRTVSSSSGSGVGIKGMSDAAKDDWIKIDGLVDVQGDVTSGRGMGEGLSAVASTIEVGGGKIIMTNDGTGETNFGGSNQLAIRAYGEYASNDYGIVNVNVVKEADTLNAKAIGAGNNIVQIVGDFSTTGGMPDRGTINVGLNTADSYWYGDYSAGGSWGVNTGYDGCLNLFMGNGAEWQGYTKYRTNLVMDTGATWYGYSHDNENLVMTLKNDAMWTPTNAGTTTLTDSKVREFTGDKGYINMSDEHGVNVTVGKFSGNTTLLYDHEIAEDGSIDIVGGNFTVQSADAGSKVTLITDNEGIDVTDRELANQVLDDMAGKLFYTGYINGVNEEDGSVVEGERNLSGYVRIAEGLTTASVTKAFGEVQFNEETGQGSVDWMTNFVQSQDTFDTPITGNATTDLAYVKGGVLNTNTGEYVFSEAETTLNKGGNVTLGGWVAATVNAVISNNNSDKDMVIDLQGNDLNINSSQTGITAGKDAKIDIYNPGKITIDTNSTGMAAAFFVKTGGQIHVHNGGEDGAPASWDNAVVVRTVSSSSGSGVGIKGMSDAAKDDWIKIDGLVDVQGDVTSGRGMGEGLSAVASTIEVGGGKIIMTNDGTGETNFGGSNQLAIRAYGEYASNDYGIVNVNVVKEADTLNAKAIGAGNNIVQIVGDFSTTGGMPDRGTINVGLNTADSYWYGDYSAGGSWGVNTGYDGCLNLFMGNGAEWQGYTKYRTNLVMDTGATWYGYSHDNENLVMTLKNNAMWTPTNAGTTTLTDSKVREFTGDKGYINMSDENGVNVTVGKFSGNTTLLYNHEIAEDGSIDIVGGNFTVQSADAGSKVTLITNNEGIDVTDWDAAEAVLDDLASKLFYTGYINGTDEEGNAVEGERNLSGYVRIAEGLTTASVTKAWGGIKYDETTGQGSVDWMTNYLKQTENVYETPITGNVEKDFAYEKGGVLNPYTGEYTFTQPETTLNKGGTVQLGGWTAASVNAVISNNNPDKDMVIDLQGNDLNINSSQTGITAGKNANIDVYNPGKITIDTNSNNMAAAFFVKTGGQIHVHNGGENGEPASWDNAVVIRTVSSYSANGVGIKSMSDGNYDDWIKVDGLVDVQGDVTSGRGMGEGLSAVASTIEVGGGKIIMTNDGSGETNFGGSNQLAIRAYGEFASTAAGIVYVNVTKEADTLDAKATGAGNNITQIVGDFSTTGGMGTKGIINVGLNTEDSFWRGDYSAGSGWGVTPGDYGVLNLWMGNGAQWEGYTAYATNLCMDSGATWYGYSHNNDNLIMSLKNDAMWTPTNAGTTTLTTSKVREFNGATGDDAIGSIYMSDDNAVNVVVGKYSGETKLFYKHDASIPSVIYGGNFTIQSAAEGSKITLVTDAEGIDFTSAAKVEDVLDSLAGKLTYTGYINGSAEDGSVIEGERNLVGYVEIAEGLTTASVSKYTGDIQFSETTGQGGFAEGTLDPEIAAPEVPETVESFNQGLTGNVVEGDAENPYKDIVDEDGTFNFTADETNIVVSTAGNVSVGVTADGDNNVTKVNANDKILNIVAATGGSGSAMAIVADGYVTDEETGVTKANEVVIDNIGSSTISAQTTGNGEAVALSAANGGNITLNVADGGVVNMTADATEGNATVIRAESGANVTINGKVNIDVTDKNVAEAIQVAGEGTVVNITDGDIKVAEGGVAIKAVDGANVNFTGSFTGDIVTAKQQKMLFAMRNVDEPTLTVVNVEVKGDSAGNYVGGADSMLNLSATKGNNWTGNIAVDSRANVTLAGGNWTGAHYGSELNMNISKGSIWTNTNEDETIINELIGAENTDKGIVGTIRMFEKVGDIVQGYGDIVVDNYKGSVIFDYALGDTDVLNDVVPEDEELVVANESAEATGEATYQVVGGKVTINNAIVGSEVVLSTAREFVDKYDVAEAEVFAALAEQINVDKNEVDNFKGYVAISEGLTNPEIKLSVSEIDFTSKVDDETGYAQGYIDKDNVNVDNNIIYGDSETALMSGTKSAMVSTAMMWRAESNDLMKRMGDLRMSEGEHGIWAKYYGGKYEMDAQKTNFSTSYNAYQVGYDRKVGRGWTVGGALSYSNGESTYTSGDGDTSVMSLGLYGTWKNNDGQYVDLILKRSKLDNEFEIKNTTGVTLESDYETWATSISAEYGKRFEQGKGFYFDPSVELTLGRVEGEEYDAKTDYLGGYKLRVQQDDFDSLVGRIGLRVGQKLDNASYYAKFAVAKEFCGEYDTKYWTVDGSGVAKYPSGTSMDMGDAWYELQLGGTAKLSDNSMVYASFERSFGGDVDQKWRVDAGLRWSF